MIVVKTILDNLALHLEEELRKNLVKYKKQATKSLYESIHVEVSEFKDSWKIIGKSLFYGTYVERGRKAGGKRVPLSVLMAWVKQKGMATGNKEISKVAWAVQMSIFKKGIKAAPFVADTLSEQREYIRQQIDIAFEDMINIAVINMVNKTNETIKKAV